MQLIRKKRNKKTTQNYKNKKIVKKKTIKEWNNIIWKLIITKFHTKFHYTFTLDGENSHQSAMQFTTTFIGRLLILRGQFLWMWYLITFLNICIFYRNLAINIKVVSFFVILIFILFFSAAMMAIIEFQKKWQVKVRKFKEVFFLP